jgi:hypothetical protein
LDERNYQRGLTSKALTRQSRLDGQASDQREFNNGIASARNGRQEDAYNRKVEHEKDLKVKRQAINDALFPDNSVAEDTGIDANVAQGQRKPGSSTKLVGNLHTKTDKKGNKVVGAIGEDGAFVPHNADPEDDDSPVAYIAKGQEEAVSRHTASTVEKSKEILPDVPEAITANAAVTAEPDGRLRPSTEEEFMAKVQKGMSPNADVPMGGEAQPQESVVRSAAQKEYPRSAAVIGEGIKQVSGMVDSHRGSGLPTVEGYNQAIEQNSAKRGESTTERNGIVGQAAHALANGVEQLPANVQEFATEQLPSSIKKFYEGGNEFAESLARGVVGNNDFAKFMSKKLFGTADATDKISVTQNAEGKPNIEVKAKVKDLEDIGAPESEAGKAATQARELNKVAGVDPEKLEEKEQAMAKAKGNIPLAKAMMDLFVIGGDVELEEVQNVRETGDMFTSKAEKAALDLGTKVSNAKLGKLNLETMKLMKELQGGGGLSEEDLQKRNTATYNNLGKIMGISIPRKGMSTEDHKDVMGSATMATFAAFEQLGMDPSEFIAAKGVVGIGTAARLYAGNQGDYMSQSMLPALAAVMSGYTSKEEFSEFGDLMGGAISASQKRAKETGGKGETEAGVYRAIKAGNFTKAETKEFLEDLALGKV